MIFYKLKTNTQFLALQILKLNKYMLILSKAFKNSQSTYLKKIQIQLPNYMTFITQQTWRLSV